MAKPKYRKVTRYKKITHYNCEVCGTSVFGKRICSKCSERYAKGEQERIQKGGFLSRFERRK